MPSLIKYSVEDASKVFDLLLHGKMYTEICNLTGLPGGTVIHMYAAIRKTNNNYRKAFDVLSDTDKAFLVDNVVSRGERIPTAKLNNKDILNIRAMSLMGISAKSISEKYSVGAGHVKNIINKKRWSHIPDPDCLRAAVCDVYSTSFECHQNCDGYFF
jgi:hypothetical protein